ncbi:MAG: zinc-ribbon domain-containing protein [Muribaculaceae bacterium]|nr:zinc-ribbon domain-containing protein [Muribaculaceae bacterium]
MSVPCEECGYPLEGNETFCPECGCPVENKKAYCPECGAKVSEEDSYCGECGYPLNENLSIEQRRIYLNSGKDQNNNKRVWLWVSAAIVFIIAGISICFFFLPNNCGADEEYVNYTKEQLLMLADKNDYEALTKAAAANNSEAQLILANLYHDGNGVKKDDNEASKWLLKAAENGNVEAQKTLARAYNLGDYGLEQDMNKGIEWFQKAADQGDEEAKEGLKSTKIFLAAEVKETEDRREQLKVKEETDSQSYQYKPNTQYIQNNQDRQVDKNSEEERRNYEQKAQELQILAKIEERGRRGKQMLQEIEVLYRAYQRNGDPESFFRLRQGLDILMDNKNQQIKLAEQLSDNASIVRELKEQRETMYKAMDMMLYGKAANPSWTW